MFGHNEIVGQKFFREHPEARAGKLLVTSVFATIQGEGPFAGEPAVFVRLAMCNLSCSFCDTFFDKGDWLTVGELENLMEDEVYKKMSDGPPLVVVTGGEPTLQLQALPKLFDIVPRVQIETNGILPVSGFDPEDKLTVVMSPKCREKDGRPVAYFRPSVEALATASCLKFVISGDKTSPYYTVPKWALEYRDLCGIDIYVSPMAEYNHVPGQTKELYDARQKPGMRKRAAAEKISFWETNLLNLDACRLNYERAGAYALKNDLRLTMQMHLFASLP